MTVRRLSPPLFAAALVAGASGACSQAQPAPWLVNETPSVPRGLYRLTPARAGPGDIVSVRPPAAARAYLAALGAPPDARLLKRVSAQAGETVCRRGQRLSWPGGAAIALAKDRAGRVLPRWSGCRGLGPDGLLVVGDTPLSFDSRYFGPVTTAQIDGVYEEVWRW